MADYDHSPEQGTPESHEDEIARLHQVIREWEELADANKQSEFPFFDGVTDIDLVAVGDYDMGDWIKFTLPPAVFQFLEDSLNHGYGGFLTDVARRIRALLPDYISTSGVIVVVYINEPHQTLSAFMTGSWTEYAFYLKRTSFMLLRRKNPKVPIVTRHPFIEGDSGRLINNHWFPSGVIQRRVASNGVTIFVTDDLQYES